MHNGALVFDPVFFEEDTGERKQYEIMQRFNARPKKESRPMCVGPDGKLHYKYETSANDLHENRMQAIFASKSVEGRTSPRTPNYAPNGVSYSQHSMGF